MRVGMTGVLSAHSKVCRKRLSFDFGIELKLKLSFSFGGMLRLVIPLRLPKCSLINYNGHSPKRSLFLYLFPLILGNKLSKQG